MKMQFEDRRLDKLFVEVKTKVPLDDTELLTPSTVFGVVPQSSLPSRPHQVGREDYVVHPARPGDFVISMSSFQHGFEYCGIEGGISPDYTLLRPMFEPEIGRFLKHSLKSDALIQRLTIFRNGIRQGQRLQWNRVRYVKIPVPDTDSARIVADFLDRETARIDQLIEKKHAFVVALEARQEGLARRLLSGETAESNRRHETIAPWLKSVPIHWKIVPLRHLVRISTGGRDTQDRADDGEYPFYVRSMNVERINTYSFDEEAVLTSGDGAGVGKVFHHVHGKFELHQRMYAFTKFKQVSGRYFFHYLKTFFHLQMTQWSAKSTVDSVRMPFLKSLLIAVPSTEEQMAILFQLDTSQSRMQALVGKTQKSIERLQEFRAAIITAAVTGQIDVATWCRKGTTDARLDAIEADMEQGATGLKEVRA